MPPRLLQISSPGGWEHYLEDLFGAGATLVPADLNPLAAPYGIRYGDGT